LKKNRNNKREEVKKNSCRYIGAVNRSKTVKKSWGFGLLQLEDENRGGGEKGDRKRPRSHPERGRRPHERSRVTSI